MIIVEDQNDKKQLVCEDKEKSKLLLASLQSAHTYKRVTYSCLIPYDVANTDFIICNVQQIYVYLHIELDGNKWSVPIWIHSIDKENKQFSTVVDIENFRMVDHGNKQIRLFN